MSEINIYLLQSLNQLTRIPFIAKVAPILADIPIFFIPLFLVYMWILYAKQDDIKGRIALLTIFYGCVFGIIIAFLIQQFIHIPRPEEALVSSGNLIMSHIPDASFPSDHATVAAAFLTGLWLTGYKKVFWIILPWFIIMDLCRIIVGVHWPADIVVGTLVGILGGYLSYYVAVQLKLVKMLNSQIIEISKFLKL